MISNLNSKRFILSLVGIAVFIGVCVFSSDVDYVQLATAIGILISPFLVSNTIK